MPDYTTKQIPKPLGPDNQDVTVLRTAFDRINDYGMGAFVCTSTSRPTGSNLWTGLAIFETDTKAYGIYDGAVWQMYDTAPVAYTPIIKDSAGTLYTLGNGSIYGRYMRRGQEISYQFKHILGSTTSWGIGGLIRFGLPLLSEAAPLFAEAPLGRATLLDSSAGTLKTFGLRIAAQPGYVNATSGDSSGDAILTSSSPWTWGGGDYIVASGNYIAAAGYTVTT